MTGAATKADAMMLMERGWQDLDSRFAALGERRGARRAAEIGSAPDKNTTLRAFVGEGSHWDTLNAENFARWRERPVAEQLAELRGYVWQPAVNHLRQHAEHIDAALAEKGAST